MMATNEFFLKDELQELILCAFCNKEYDTPKVLPCGESICTHCERKSTAHQVCCTTCSKQHDIPEDGFPVNLLIQKLIKLNPKKVYRGELHQNAMASINKVGLFNRKLEAEVSNLDSVVTDYCDLLRDNVDLKTESAIDTLQKHREKFMNEINEYQKKCLGNSSNLDEFKKFITQSKDNYDTWVAFINSANISDKEIENVLKASDELLIKLNSNRKNLDLVFFGEEKLEFRENKSEINSNVVGMMNYFNSGVRNLLENKPASIINYKNETSTITFYNTIMIPIDEEKVCIALTVCHNGSYLLKLKLYSLDGCFIKEISEQLYSSYTDLGAARFKDNILIRATLSSGGSTLKLYNQNLEEIKRLGANYHYSLIYTNDNRIYVYYFSNNYWTIYDENLNQIEQIATGSTTSYPFIPHNSAQIEFKYGRLFTFYNHELIVADNETRTILKTIKLDRNDIIVKPVSSEKVMIIDKKNKNVEVLDLDLQRLIDAKIENISDISSVSLTSEDNIVIYDSSETKAYIF